MTNRWLLVVVLFLSLANILIGQEQKEDITTTFFKNFKENPTGAYVKLFENNKWMKDKKSDIETVKIKLGDFLSSLGEYYGYEPITQKGSGESYILKSFLVRYERQPLRFTFVLYKANKSWQIQNFTYDTNIDDELREAAKVYRLKDNW